MLTETDYNLRRCLTAVYEAPDDDTLRVICADAYQEAGEEARAEFIRVQVGMAASGLVACRRPRAPGPGAAGNPYRVDCRRCDFCVPAYRSAELLAAHRREWLTVPCEKCGGAGWSLSQRESKKDGKSCPDCRSTGDAGGLTWELPGYFVPDETSVRIPHPEVEFARGFPHRVTVPRLADCLDERVEGTLVYPNHWGHVPSPWLAAVVRHHPTLAECVCLDREPDASAQHSGWYRWYVEDGSHNDGLDRSVIPAAIYSGLEGEYPEDRNGASKQPYWRTREAAVSALARRVVAWARSFK